MGKYNSALRNCSWNSFCHVSGIWHCTKLVPLVLEMTAFFSLCIQILVAGRAVTAWATTLEQDVASSQGTLPRAPGAARVTCVKPGTKTWQMFDFPEPPQHLGLTQAQLSLSPAMLQHFHPPCSFLLLAVELSSVTPLSQLSHMGGDIFAATLKCLLLLLGNSFYISLLVSFPGYPAITVQCVSSKLVANIKLHWLISFWMLLNIQDFPSLGSAPIVINVHYWMCSGERFLLSLMIFANKKVLDS